MKIESFSDAAFGVNSYLIEENGHALLIDPVLTVPLRDAIRMVTVDFAVLTHEHFDHIRSVAELRETYGIRVLCGEKAVKGLSNPHVNLSSYASALKQYLPFGNAEPVDTGDYVCCSDGVLADGQSLIWQGHALKAFETPGHSIGSICILLDETALFSGDTVFRDCATATRMPGGNTKQFRSVTEPALDALPKTLTVYPGHMMPFALGERFRSETGRK